MDMDQEHIRAIELAYSKLIQPKKIIGYFETVEKFKEWVDASNASDLRACLIAFEKAELFDHCTIIKEAINQKENVQPA